MAGGKRHLLRLERQATAGRTPAGWRGPRARVITGAMGRFIAIFLLATPVVAETPLSPAEFEAMVEGRTLSYATGGVPYGAEEYLRDRRVRWSHLDGACEEGRWYAAGDEVCFVYEGIEAPQCWQFFKRDEGLVAEFRNSASPELYELSAMRAPLQCMGPEVGV